MGFYLVPLSAAYFSVISFFSNFLCSWSTFYRLQDVSSCCLWCLLSVGKFGSVGCVGFLVEGTGACVLVDEAVACLSGDQDHVLWCVLGCL